jgi:hypothetical protein
MMKVLGLFRELSPRHDKSLPSIFGSRGMLPTAMIEPVLEYLESGIDVIDFMEATRDPFDHSKYIPGGPSLTTDERWIWRHDLSHFVRMYQIGLPEEFLLQVERAGKVLPNQVSVAEVTDEVLATYAATEKGEDSE